jgi:PBP1b-binding outer membrane lipoprotein LpoB
MRAIAIILALVLAGCESQPQVTFADVAYTLPDDPLDLPPGPGRQAVIENCTACHSPSTMLQQPQISREKWQSILGKMVEVYKAPVEEASIPLIIDYLMMVQEKPPHRRAVSRPPEPL